MTSDNEKEDLVISEFLRAIGAWRKYIVIGGGYALIIYRLYQVNEKKGNPPVGTHDIDSLIPRRVPTASTKDIGKHLIEAGFKQFCKDYDNPATEAYVKEINGYEVEIECLTSEGREKGENVVIAGAGVVAQPLTYLKQSLENAMEFKTRSGDVGQVVSPGAWIFHKVLHFASAQTKQRSIKIFMGSGMLHHSFRQFPRRLSSN